MESMFGIDFDKSYEEMMEYQEKLLGGLKVMMNLDYNGSDTTPKKEVFQLEKVTLYHYIPRVKNPIKTPTLIVYALVNKQYMMDLQRDKSVIMNLLDQGTDLYIIDWGYPEHEDMYTTLDDYINYYLDSCVDEVLRITGAPQLNILGVCQGGTFSLIYTALHQKKVKNLITMVTPAEFDVNEGLLIQWSKNMNIPKIVEAFGVVPGDFMNFGFNLLKPYQLMVDKYVDLIENIDNPQIMENFMRMEKWIFDSPAQAGKAYEEFLVKMYQKNELAKGTLEVGGHKVDLKNITCPLLNIYAEFDHLVPPSASIPINNLVGSKDTMTKSFPVGHIGMYVSSRSQREVSPTISNWLKEHD